MKISLLTTRVSSQNDVWLTRHRARQLAGLLGFDPQDQTRIATSVSEIARNAFQHAGGGKVEFSVNLAFPQLFQIIVRDTGPGIVNVDALLARPRSHETDAATSLRGVRRLMDRFTIATGPTTGTTVTLAKLRPRRLPLLQQQEIAGLVQRLTETASEDPLLEIQRQNQELLRTLDALRTQQEEVLVREQWLSATLQSIGDAVIATDAAGCILFMNAVAERLTGWARGEATGKALDQVVCLREEKTGTRVQIPLARILSSGEQFVLPESTLLVSQQGTETYVSDSSSAIHDPAGEVTGAVLVLRDMTQASVAQRERQHLLAQVEVERTRLRTLMEQMPAGVFLVEAVTGTLLFANHEAERIYGIAATQGSSAADWIENRVRHLTGAPLGPGENPVARTLATGENTQDQLFQIERGDGTRATLLVNTAPVRNEHGQISAVVVAFYDVTERMGHLQEIEHLNQRLSRTILETHHRVKNNLQVISALVEVQIGENNQSVPQSAMTRIGEHARALAGLHDLLTHEARISAETDWISSRAMIEKLMSVLRLTTGGRALRCEADDFPLSVKQSASLAMLTSEVVSNSVKHGQGEIELRLINQDGTAVLEISDSGPGFPTDFDSRTSANTGLSLIDSAGAYDLGGAIAFENRPEGGACVRVTFPLQLEVSEARIGVPKPI